MSTFDAFVTPAAASSSATHPNFEWDPPAAWIALVSATLLPRPAATISLATVTNSTTMRVTFRDAAATSASLTNASNWTVTLTGSDDGVIPTISTVVAAAGGYPAYVDVTMSEMSDSQSYKIGYTGITGATNDDYTVTGTNSKPTVTVTGFYFTSNCVIKTDNGAGAVTATSITFVDGSELRAIIPTESSSTQVDIHVVLGSRTYIKQNAYTHA